MSAPAEALPGNLRRKIALLKPVLRFAGPVAPVRSAIVEAMLTARAAADPQVRGIVVESIRRPHRSSMVKAANSLILNRVDVSAELADITVPCLYIASDDRGDWAPEDAEKAARLTPRASAVTVSGARTLIPLEQPAEVARLVTNFAAQASSG